ncbi:beta-aspartyl-peptidase [Clostridium cylindrosporum]|uniref:Isoaspartyl dipeptidase n=1 Tax=Clostridium cylindrosporum DSM 605 TaxID=1121307 RepID=A0A0J8FZ34_CLOCY|nr:beta-aspartyl-peptidase [Clostridium cylindrosporum]KMT20881.1 isoaspartyl dipeptidase IadA [Clostridium cylindrosporum DSM 605]
MLLIKNINIYSPTSLGKKDILICYDKILYISEDIKIPENFPDCKTIDGSNFTALPGIVDLHVHIAGAGGEGGFSSRTPEMTLSNLTLNGITTCVGLLGTDGSTRSMGNLLAKANSLDEEGITTYIWTGSYQIPTRTLTSSARGDIIFVDKIIGIGEIAISDHRGSHPSDYDLIHLASEARVGGLISGKCGITHIHIGDGRSMIDPLKHLVESSEIPLYNILPTHINRNSKLFKECIDYCKLGGYVDITTGIRPNGDDVVDPTTSYRALLDEGCNIENITMSSDSGGSMPIFNESGKLEDLTIGLPSTNLEVFRDLVRDGMSIDKAIIPLTSNPSKLLKLLDKGHIKEGFSADIMLLDKDYNLHTLISRGKIMVENYKAVVKGKFEA